MQRWIVPGYLMRGTVTLLAGPPSAGKSLISVGMAIACALGRAWGRFKPISSLRVGLYNVEDDDDEQRRRLSATLRQFDVGPDAIRGRLVRLHPGKSPVLLKWGMDDQAGYGLLETPLMNQLEAFLGTPEATNLDVLFLDPMVELHTAPENDNGAQRAVVAYFRLLAQRFNIAIVLVHHSRKGSAQGAGDMDTARGASSIIGACRTVLTCLTMTEAEASKFGVPAVGRHQFCRLDGAKSNYGANGSEMWFEKTVHQLDNGPDGTPGDLVAAMVPWQTPKESGFDMAVLLDVESGIARGTSSGPYSPTISDNERSIARLLTIIGIEGTRQKAALVECERHLGVVRMDFCNAKRSWRSGLRTKAGAPKARWLDQEEGAAAPEAASLPASERGEDASEIAEPASPSEAIGLDWNFGEDV